MRSLVKSILLHAYESWTLTAQLQRRIPQDTTHLLQRPCYQRGSPCQDPAGNRTKERPDHRKETQTAVVWTCLPFIRSGQRGEEELVSSHFEPSQPPGFISGLKETFIKRYIAERTNKAETRPGKQSEKTKSCRENLWNEIQSKGSQRQKYIQEQNKKE